MIWILACADPPVVGAGFSVASVSPEDGATDVVEAHLPELRFSDAIDPETCGDETVRLDGVHDDLSVAFRVEGELILVDEGAKVQFRHDNPLPRGWRYAITVRGGDDGCSSAAGDAIHPFDSTFEVP